MFEYKYLTITEIFNKIKLIKDFSIIEISILIFLIAWFLVSLYFVFPLIYNYYLYLNEKKHENKKLDLLKKIQIEKEIEEKYKKELEEL